VSPLIAPCGRPYGYEPVSYEARAFTRAKAREIGSIVSSPLRRCRVGFVKGVFSEWQPHYALRRIATFPVGHDKKPQIRRWNKVGLSGSAKLAQRFTQANALGFQAGPRSRVTVLDIFCGCHQVQLAFVVAKLGVGK
jgi:hypothetical protein